MDNTFSLIDTICAPATPHGIAPIGIIRISGPKALLFAQHLVRSSELTYPIMISQIYDHEEKPFDLCLLLNFKEPHSYTGEDMVEVHHHGSPIIAQQILNLAIDYGIRMATRGEFTLRAYRHGKVTLGQAEEIGRLIHARSLTEVQQAVTMLTNPIESFLEECRDIIQKTIIQLEASVNFPLEVTEVPTVQLVDLSKKIDKVIFNTRQIDLWSHGLTIGLVGKVNVGKSSLMNCLSKQHVSLVSNIPGTTRDTLKTTIFYRNTTVNFLDTPGLRETDNEIELLGIEQALRRLQGVQHIIWLEESHSKTFIDVRIKNLNIPMTVIKTKSDLWKKSHCDYPTITTQDPENIEPVYKVIDQVIDSLALDHGYSTSMRYMPYLLSLRKILQEIIALDGQKTLCYESMLLLLNEAITILQEMITVEDQDTVDMIFNNFCIGK